MGRPPGNLPLQFTSFIGRERERIEISRLLETSRLVTLTGAGGCGKTRLALDIAVALSAMFADGTWLVDLAPVSDPLFVPQRLSATLDVRARPDQTLETALVDLLRDKQMLLLFDNCEHVLAASARLVESLLRGCPHLKILATSRKRLDLAVEQNFRLPSLASPDPNLLPPLDLLSQYEAVQLLLDRVRSVEPAFSLTERNALPIAQICYRLAGMPLAIELAAARLKMLSALQLAARLDDAFQVLTKGSPYAPRRHQTLRATLDWSHALLGELEQVLFRRLAVFAVGFTLEAVEAICADVPRPGQLPPAQLLDSLSELADHSLLIVDVHVESEAARYRMLEPVHQYARQKLAEAGEEGPIRDRHLAYFLCYAKEAAPKLHGSEQALWFQRLEAEYHNIISALKWSLADGSLELGTRLAGQLQWHWYVHGHLGEARELVNQLLARGTDSLAKERTDSDGRAGIGAGSPGSSPEAMPCSTVSLMRAKLLQVGTMLAHHTGNAEAALLMLQESLDIARSQGLNGRPLLPRTLNQLGYQLMNRDPDAARVWLAEAVTVSHELGNQWERAHALNLLGVLSARGKHYEQAVARFRESFSLLRALGDRWFSSRPLVNLATTLYQQGNLDAAWNVWLDGVGLFRELDDSWLLAYAFGSLGDIERLQGKFAQAQAHYAESAGIHRKRSIYDPVALPIGQLGYIRAADAVYGATPRGPVLSRATGQEIGIARAITAFARLSAASGQPERAARLFGAAEAMYAAIQIAMPLREHSDHEQSVATARSELDEATFAKAWREGRAWTAQQAMDYACAELTRPAEGVFPPPAILRAGPQEQAGHDLLIYAFGSECVYRAGSLVTAHEWKYTKAKELLYYLLCNSPATRGEAGLALWPDFSQARLRNIFGVTMYHLRRALGDADWVILEGNAYVFNRLRDYWFDVEVFESNLAQAQKLLRAPAPERQEAILKLQGAVELYHGDFLQDVAQIDWCLLRREELRRKHLEALLTLGQLLYGDKQYGQAARTYERAIVQDSYLEVAHRELMRCYVREGERGQALRHYGTLLSLMRDELGSAPAAETTALYERIQHGEET